MLNSLQIVQVNSYCAVVPRLSWELHAKNNLQQVKSAK